jgi:hypothetical protein
VDVRQVIPRDAIPSVDDPTFTDTYPWADEDQVIVVQGSPSRAYPVRILDYHEVVNDVLDGCPIAVTWCPLCGSAIVYDRRIDDRTLTFGVSGKLADDDLVLYDRETETEWKQSLGRAIAGQLEGRELDLLTFRMSTAGRFAEEFPHGEFLTPPEIPSEAASETDEPAPVEYDATPYRAYVEGDGFGLEAHRGTGSGREWARHDLDPKTVVLGVVAEDAARGYPEDWVRGVGGMVTDDLGELSLLVVAGEGLHAYRDPGYEWRLEGDRLVADGTTWDPATGEAGDGRSLERIPARRLFAFTWQDDHGSEAFWSPR